VINVARDSACKLQHLLFLELEKDLNSKTFLEMLGIKNKRKESKLFECGNKSNLESLKQLVDPITESHNLNFDLIEVKQKIVDEALKKHQLIESI